jgi:putative ATP-binding cassette transporter
MQLIRFLFRQSRRLALLSAAVGVLSGAGSTALLAVINLALGHGATAGPAILWAFAGLCLLVPVCRFFADLLLIHLGQGTVYRLRMDLSRRVLAVPLRHLEEIGAHRILSSLTEDIPTITNVVSLVPTVCINSALLLGSLIYLGWLSLKVLAVVLLLTVAGVLTYRYPSLRAVRHLRRARDLNDDLIHHFRALTDGAKELKQNRSRAESFLERDLETTTAALRDENVSGWRLYALAASRGQFLVFSVVGLLLFALPRFTPVPAAALTGYTLTLLYLMTPMQILLNVLPQVGRAGIALGRIEELGARLGPAGFGADRALPAPAWRRLELRGVTHSYRSEEDRGFVLGPIDLTVTPGELVFIVGGNGSGKTTLAKLLTGLYAPESGEVRLDGETITDRNRDRLRQHFSAIFSDFHLFRTLHGIGGPDLSGRADALLDRVQLRHKVAVEGDRFTTIDLSQGQRKRLALVTALLEDRPIYLFDEWAADQDPRFKELFYRELLPWLRSRGKAAIVISHDDRYYETADCVTRLEDGKVSTQRAVSAVS